VSALDRDLERLVDWLDQEVEARRELIDLLERQERAVLAAAPGDLEAATLAVGRALEREPASSARRRELFASLARAWRASSDALTLGSIAERAGDHPSRGRIEAARRSLREAVVEVARRNRRVAALVRARRRVVGELVGLIVRGAEDASPVGAGTLVDARA